MARQWQEAETLELFTYSNEFGEAVLTPVTDFMPVSSLESKKVPEIATVLISMDDAEKLVLITENRRSGVSFLWPLTGDCYALKYSCPSRAAVCRVAIKSFKTPGNVSARDQIEAMRPRGYHY